MHEAERVLERLRRIRELERRRAPAATMLPELRQLVGEAEAWARLEGDERARAAAAELAGHVARVGEVEPATAAVN
jgi:hypothetical protein